MNKFPFVIFAFLILCSFLSSVAAKESTAMAFNHIVFMVGCFVWGMNVPKRS